MACLIFILSAAGAAISFRKVSQLRSEASWLSLRADAHAANYAASLESSLVDTELISFDQRRALLVRAHLWQRLEIVCVLFAAAAALFAYGFYLLRRARQYGMAQR